MIIGTASVIAVLGVGKAASGGIAGTLDSFGDPGIIVQVDLQQDDPGRRNDPVSRRAPKSRLRLPT